MIGDDSNLIREFPPLPGRIYSVAVSPDGKRIAAGSSLDGTGEVAVYGYEFDTELAAPTSRRSRRRWSRPARPRKPPTLEKYHKEGVKQIASVKVPARRRSTRWRSGPTARSWPPPAADGIVRLLNPETGSIVKEFAPVTVKAASAAQNAPVTAVAPKQEEAGRDRVAAHGGEPGVARGPARRRSG